MTLSGRPTQPEDENVERLLTPHAPSSEVTQELVAPAATLRAGRSD